MFLQMGSVRAAEIQQYFPGHCTFSGRVVDIHKDVDKPGEVLFEAGYLVLLWLLRLTVWCENVIWDGALC
jgi:hypothetical protein